MANQYRLTVDVNTQFLKDDSKPAHNEYVFAYTIRITNSGNIAAQVISRHWIITDANNRVQEVRGLGVVGQQPLLQPGETFEYTSGAPLATAIGTMKGAFQAIGEDGHLFKVSIEEFTLAAPHSLH